MITHNGITLEQMVSEANRSAEQLDLAARKSSGKTQIEYYDRAIVMRAIAGRLSKTGSVE